MSNLLKILALCFLVTICFTGCNDAAELFGLQTLEDNPDDVTAAFSWNTVNKNQTACPCRVQFTDESVNALSWQYDFGDGTGFITRQNPVHTYSNPNCTSSFDCTYTVTLTACPNSSYPFSHPDCSDFQAFVTVPSN